MKRRALALVGVLLSAPVLAGELRPNVQCFPAQVHANDKIIKLMLEPATTPKAREVGLMNRDRMGACDGMAFFFPKPARQKFWMKQTRIPLDILFVDADHRIVAIITGKPHDETPIGPDEAIASVIEIDGGRAARDGINIGDKIHYGLRNAAQHPSL